MRSAKELAAGLRSIAGQHEGTYSDGNAPFLREAADYIERTAAPAEAIAAAEEMRKTAQELRETSNGNTNAIEQALYWERKAASLLAAPANLVLETTAEERSAVLAAEKSISLSPGDIPGTVIRLLRDHDTLTAALAAANERAASEAKRAAKETERAIRAGGRLGMANLSLVEAEAERDREAAARREAEDLSRTVREELARQVHEKHAAEARAEQSEAERATLRAAGTAWLDRFDARYLAVSNRPPSRKRDDLLTDAPIGRQIKRDQELSRCRCTRHRIDRATCFAPGRIG